MVATTVLDRSAGLIIRPCTGEITRVNHHMLSNLALLIIDRTVVNPEPIDKSNSIEIHVTVSRGVKSAEPSIAHNYTNTLIRPDP